MGRGESDIMDPNTRTKLCPTSSLGIQMRRLVFQPRVGGLLPTVKLGVFFSEMGMFPFSCLKELYNMELNKCFLDMEVFHKYDRVDFFPMEQFPPSCSLEY